jgi:energy-coupling factor transporter ATP-binding protein EcfA2
MRLVSVKYSELRGTPQEWTLDGLRLGSRNLIVGKNASGKTRVLNIINGLAGHLAGLRPLTLFGDYDVTFDNDGRTLKYELRIEQQRVVKEKFSVGGSVVLDRGSNGEGSIRADEIDGGKDIRFETPPTQLAAVVRRDAIQHRFLEPLHAWASSLRLYCFGTFLGKDRFAMFTEGGLPWDERDPNNVVALYRRAQEEYKEDFKREVIAAMHKLEYDVDDVGIQPPTSIRFVGLPILAGLSGFGGPLCGLYVKERDLSGITDQNSMSQGMFRALSILIQVIYSQMANKATCILIDDIGEGLDFERSWRLIDLLRHKVDDTKIQLVLSTNDRFVMNHVPLEEWSVLQRRGGHVQVRNYDNSREVFEEFQFTGLSNFSFLEMDFVSGAPVEAHSHE